MELVSHQDTLGECIYVLMVNRNTDLMLPGVRLLEGKIESLGQFDLNEKRAIVLSSNP